LRVALLAERRRKRWPVVRISFVAGWLVRAGLAIVITSVPARAEIIETPADESNAAAAPAAPPSSETPALPSVSKTRPKSHGGVHRHALSAASRVPIEIEPAQAALPLVATTNVLAAPSPNAKVIKTLASGTSVTITGSTSAYLRIDTARHTGYIRSTAVHLVKPGERVLRLTADSPVYSQPNRWGSVLAQVHQGHDVHVVGSALSYVKIQMKSGLEGFVPVTALQ
jgi:hypothetical protein